MVIYPASHSRKGTSAEQVNRNQRTDEGGVMKILCKAVLVGWALAAATGAFCGANASADTVTASGAGGASASDTGWG
jgi:hypothetical protein